jgi:predicted secreted hydrolase
MRRACLAPLRRIPFVIRHSSFVILFLLAACGQPTPNGGKAAWPGPFSPPPQGEAAPRPIAFPRDEAPHDTLTEWWYYTGHLRAEDGTRYGFESVIFQSIRSDIPPYFSAHTAITDRQRGTFRYDQRTQSSNASLLGTEANKGFDFRIGDWAWRGLDGHDHVEGTIPGYAITLDLAGTKPPALHKGGYIDYGAAGGSYYYSRTRMTVSGTIVDNGVRKAVTGDAWFDHQWGNFLTVSTGGWDWFSAHLDDGSDFTIYLIKGEGRQVLGSLGTYVAPDGTTADIPFADVKVEVLNQWKSPYTGVTYPSGWRVSLPTLGLVLTWTPVVLDQELDTRQSTANIYWEGEVTIAGTRNGAPVGGQGYVELTGYDQK